MNKRDEQKLINASFATFSSIRKDEERAPLLKLEVHVDAGKALDGEVPKEFIDRYAEKFDFTTQAKSAALLMMQTSGQYKAILQVATVARPAILELKPKTRMADIVKKTARKVRDNDGELPEQGALVQDYQTSLDTANANKAEKMADPRKALKKAVEKVEADCDEAHEGGVTGWGAIYDAIKHLEVEGAPPPVDTTKMNKAEMAAYINSLNS